MGPFEANGPVAELVAPRERARSGTPIDFSSILDRDAKDDPPGTAQAPDYFRDLNIDQIVAAITAGREEYDLAPFFYRRLEAADKIAYRQEIMQDLEAPGLLDPIVTFAERMQEMRSRLRGVEKAYYRWQKKAWLLEAAAHYCAAVGQLSNDLAAAAPRSQGLREFCGYLRNYAGSPAFATLAADTERMQAALRTPHYCVQLHDLAVTVRRYEDEIDYSGEIEATFAQFRQGKVKSYLMNIPEYSGMNHVEAQIVEFVAKLYPDIFNTLSEYCERHRDFADPTLRRFDREIQFYIAFLGYIGRMRAAGLPFCYPEVTRQAKVEYGHGIFDLALAAKLTSEGKLVVPNDFALGGEERVIVVSGPNQGGKTTFSRTFGQLHHFASLGCPVPGTAARLFICDRILTHYEKQENIENLHGKLQDDLLRIRRIIEEATPNSIVIMNEIFSSTALADAVFLATEVMQRILRLGCLGICVTFLDEIATLGPSVVSMVSTVVPEDPAQRTFKLVRRPADGRAYAMAIAEKHRLDYPSLRQRLPR